MNYKPFYLVVILMLSYFISLSQKIRKDRLVWRIAASIPSEKRSGTIHGLAGMIAGFHNDHLLAAGGANFPDTLPWHGGIKKFYSDIHVYRREGARLVLLPIRQELPISIAYAASCSTPYGVFFAGGENQQGPVQVAGLLRFSKEIGKVERVALPELPFPVSNAMAVYLQDEVYVAGGENTDSTLSGFIKIDLRQPEKGWEILPCLPHPVSHFVFATSTIQDSNCLLLAGGRARVPGAPSVFYRELYSYNIQTRQWRERSPLPYALAAGAGSAIHNNGLMLLGGDRGVRYNQVEQLLIEAKNEKDPSQLAKLKERRIQLQESHPGFSREQLYYDASIDQWSSKGDFPYELPVTTPSVFYKGYLYLVSGEIKAGIRTPSIYSGKLIRTL